MMIARKRRENMTMKNLKRKRKMETLNSKITKSCQMNKTLSWIERKIPRQRILSQEKAYPQGLSSQVYEQDPKLKLLRATRINYRLFKSQSVQSRKQFKEKLISTIIQPNKEFNKRGLTLYRLSILYLRKMAKWFLEWSIRTRNP